MTIERPWALSGWADHLDSMPRDEAERLWKVLSEFWAMIQGRKR